MVKTDIAENSSSKKSSKKPLSSVTKKSKKEKTSSVTSSASVKENNLEDTSEASQYFKVGDYVDVKDNYYGSWFIGKLVKIKKDNSSTVKPQDPKIPVENDGLIYVVEYFQCTEESDAEVPLQEIRPHGSEIIPLNTLKTGDHVLMNYNVDYPKERGYWYDVIVKQVKNSRRGNVVIGDVSVGIGKAVLSNCSLVFVDDIYMIKPYELLVNRTPEEDEIMQKEPAERAGALYCITCKDKANKSCKECGCHVCGGKENEDRQLMCDECNHPYHMECLTPPLKVLPKDHWYCPSCKNDENEIVNVGDKLKTSKKKTPGSTSKRDWGNGMACVGRTSICTIVPPTHFGPIPGIEVGTTWLYRLQVSEAGVHRPPIGGIHGRETKGAFSIVLSGGYEDDIDYGEEFMYTGSGGRDLSGNKRTASQSSNQVLNRSNRALALNCNANIDNKNGAEAVDWKQGKAVRVVRSFKLIENSKYAPKEGNRYDGIYKVVKYYPEIGKSGFIVWRFLLRRDDPAPAPWTVEGMERMAQLGLELILPVNYVTKEIKPKSSRRSKRKNELQDTDVEQLENIESENNNKASIKKKVKINYELEKELEKLITADVANKKYWNDCKDLLDKGKKAFLNRVEETFLCICCQEIVFNPITTECSHNICKSCLKRSFKAEVFQCPTCRADLDKNCLKVNGKLAKTLMFIFPGYNTDRE